MAAKFNSSSPGQQETMWVLNEPFSGLLLTVAFSESEVLDASLHYNVRTEDTALLHASFPEHRNLDAGTLYVRESCVDQLRARCRRIRATGNAEREWTVGPTIYLLTPAEWESALGDFGDPPGESALSLLNRQRIESLPEPIRRQFRLAPTS